jgi:hypothetical protein
MTIKVSLCEVSIIRRVAELPDKCPHCGADLHAELALKCGEYNISEQEFSADSSDWGDYKDGLSDDSYPIYWKCKECGKTLVEGVEHYASEEESIGVNESGTPTAKEFGAVVRIAEEEACDG